MRRLVPSSLLAGALLAMSATTGAAFAQQRPAARPLGPVLATSAEALGALSAVRQLPGGRVLVNDPAKRRVLLLDSTLAIVTVVADSTSSTASAYGPRPGGLIAWRGDSTLFVDPMSLSMLLIDPSGKIARVMAAPRPNDVAFLTGGPWGAPGFDAQGRLVYRTMSRPTGRPPEPGQPMSPPVLPDSQALVRFDFATRKLDTAAFVRVPAPRMNVVQNERGVSVTSMLNPMPTVDDWAVLPDGGIALVRGRDYHVDFISPDGSRTSSPKVAFDWVRLSEDDKVAVIDSVRKAMEASRAASASGATPPSAGNSDITGASGRQVVTTMTMSAGPGGGATTIVGGPATGVQIPMPVFVPPSELPDYRPAFASGATRVDPDGRLWIRTIPTKPLAGGPEYDVIDRSGKLVDRVAIPKGTTIVGFGTGGIVYLGVRDAAGVHVVKAKAR